MSGDRERDLAELGDYVRTLADRMGLKDWTVGATGDMEASVLSPAARRAVAFIRDDFRDETPEVQRYLLVRYLVLCHFHPARRAVLFATQDGAWEEFKRSLDAGIDAIAAAWAPCLPLPLAGLMRRLRRAETSAESI